MFITKDELNKGMYNYMYIKYEKYFNYNLNKYINTYVYAHRCIGRKSTNMGYRIMYCFSLLLYNYNLNK